MPAPLASQVLFAAGGDVLSKYGTLIWRKGLQTRGGEIPYTFTRTGTGLYLANDVVLGGLKVLTAGSGLARVEQLVDPVNGVLQSYLKLEAASSNWALQSQTLNVTWTKTGLLSVNQTATAAPDQTTTGNLLTEDSSTGVHQVGQSITITAQEYIALSAFVKSGARTKGQLFTQSTPTSTDWFGISFDLGLGTVSSFVSGNGTLTGSAIIPLASGWYWVAAWGRMSGVSTDTAGNMTLRLRDAAGAQSYTGDGASGMYWWGAQFERNGANALPPTSYIATVAAKVDRNADVWSTPWYIAVPVGVAGGFWRYTRWLERGTFAGANTKYQSAMGVTATRWILLNEAGTNPRVIWNNGVAAEQRVTAGVSPTFGQIAETLEVVDAAGNMTLRTAINAGADNVVTAVGGAPTGKSFDTATLNIGSASAGASPGYTNLSRCVVGLGAVSAIADVRGIL